MPRSQRSFMDASGRRLRPAQSQGRLLSPRCATSFVLPRSARRLRFDGTFLVSSTTPDPYQKYSLRSRYARRSLQTCSPPASKASGTMSYRIGPPACESPSHDSIPSSRTAASWPLQSRLRLFHRAPLRRPAPLARRPCLQPPPNTPKPGAHFRLTHPIPSSIVAFQYGSHLLWVTSSPVIQNSTRSFATIISSSANKPGKAAIPRTHQLPNSSAVHRKLTRFS